ncbi:MAG TPA: hypothetical protein VFL57_21490 [Bryobacteraceae bacterium]|nr:hypothetical protein [Bryobacteraceae bacterium]
MQTHIRIVGWLHVVFGVVGILIGLAGFAFFGGIAGLIGMTETSDEKFVAMPIVGAIGGLILIFMLIISIPGLIVGYGLVSFRPWSRVLGIVMSALHLLNVPFGTALGIYGLWVLLNDQSAAILEGRTAPPLAPQPPYPPQTT